MKTKSTPNFWRNLVLTLLTSLGLWISFPTFDLEAAAFFALIPLLYLFYNEKPLNSFYYGFGAGTLFYLLSVSWVTNTMVNYGGLSRPVAFLILLLLALYLGLYFGVFGFIFSRYIRGQGAWEPLGAALLWVALEYLRTYLITGFPWNALGYSQYKNLFFIQIASLGSVYIVSFLLVFFNAAVTYSLWNWLFIKEGDKATRRQGDKKKQNKYPDDTTVSTKPYGLWAIGHWLPSIAAILIVGISYAHGYWALHQPLAGKTIKVAMVQGNIDQGVKWNPAFLQKNIDIYQRLSLEAVKDAPQLLVWPEAAMPFFLAQDTTNNPRVLKIAQDLGVPILTGSDYRGLYQGKRRNFNSAFLLTPQGEIGGRYDKIHLVPFGEYVPLQKLLFFVEKMVVGVGDFAPGERAVVFSPPSGSFGVTICYENIFPALVRDFTNNGADFLVNITNDSWFGRSAAAYQHLSMSTFRAIENRRWIVRAAQTGISALINPQGRIVMQTPIFQEAYLVGQIQLLNHKTFYLAYGDVFAVGCVVLVISFFLGQRFYIRR